MTFDDQMLVRALTGHPHSAAIMLYLVVWPANPGLIWSCHYMDGTVVVSDAHFAQEVLEHLEVLGHLV